MILDFFCLSKFHKVILKIFSANAASIEPSFMRQICWNSPLISSDDQVFDAAKGERIDYQLIVHSPLSRESSRGIDYQLIANSKLRFVKPHVYTVVFCELDKMKGR